MDLSKLSQNQKMGAYGAIAVVIGGLAAVFSYVTYSAAWLGLLAGLGMLAVLFLPQLAPKTSLPGSTGTLMLVTGGVAGIVLVLLFLVNIGFVFTRFGIADLFFLLAVAGAAVMAWAGWREFQAEGGTLRFGSSAAGATTADAPTASPEPEAHREPAMDDSAHAHNEAPAHDEHHAAADEPPAEEHRTGA